MASKNTQPASSAPTPGDQGAGGKTWTGSMREGEGFPNDYAATFVITRKR